ncbi:MAG: hypothetical protein HKN03_09090 [Acidimicrobiales bacterium]|nr:hypothetical protein [Acidimicrobiales bacterium]
MSRYTPPKQDEADGPHLLTSLAPMRRRRPVVFWIVIIGVLAMVLSTVGSLITLILT